MWKEFHISASLHILVAVAVIMCGWYMADAPLPVVVLLTLNNNPGGGGGGSSGNAEVRNDPPTVKPVTREPKKRLRAKVHKPPKPVSPAATTWKTPLSNLRSLPRLQTSILPYAETGTETQIAGSGTGRERHRLGHRHGSGSGVGSGSGSGIGSGIGGSVGPGKGDGETPENLKKRYLRKHFAYIRDLILKNLTYPPIAKKLGWHGGVTVSFVVRENGYTEKIKIVKNSGHDVLDQNVVRTIRDVEPFPKPPIRAELVIPVVYRLE
jgi:protein TonB